MNTQNPQFDFTTIMDRRGHDALAVDGVGRLNGFAPELPEDGFDVIPMWVADMNFPTAPSIIKAIQRRIEHPAFGYFQPTDAYYDSIIRWLRERHGVAVITKEDISYENGVLGGVASYCCILRRISASRQCWKTTATTPFTVRS